MPLLFCDRDYAFFDEGTLREGKRKIISPERRSSVEVLSELLLRQETVCHFQWREEWSG